MIKNLLYLYQTQRTHKEQTITMKIKKYFYKYKEYIIFLNKFYIKVIFLILYYHEIYNFCLHYKKKK